MLLSTQLALPFIFIPAFMLLKCLTAFETCALRFPQHYKSIYRLAHFYFRSKEHRDLSKCRDLLLGRYQTPKGTILGLFSERKNTNFFNVSFFFY